MELFRGFVVLLVVTGVSRVSSSECKTDSDCQLDGAVCSSGTCGCPPQYVANSIKTKCLPITSGIGASCTDNLQCSTSLASGGFCNKGLCDCQPGYHYLIGHCWKTSGLGDSCHTDENCFVDQDFEGAFCNENKKCECRPDYYQRDHSSCRKISLNPGDPCGITVDCQFDEGICFWNHTCGVGTAAQALDYIYFEAVPPNLPTSLTTLVQDGGSCKTNADCAKNAVCSYGKCLCSPGFYTLQDTTCHPEVAAKCTADSDCIGQNTFCRNATHCACTEGHVISTDRRYCDKLSRNLGWSCLRDAWCAYFGPNGVCLNKKCACSDKSHYVDKEMYCWTTRKAGDRCESEYDCGINQMSCVQGTCQCQSGTHPSSSGEECREDSTSVGKPCVESIDCKFPHATCNNATLKCDCAETYVLNDKTCVPGINGPCSNGTGGCFMKNSQCLNDTCECNEGFLSNSAFSVCLTELNSKDEPCVDSTQCVKFNGVCNGGQCVCEAGKHFSADSKCYKDVQLGGACEKNGECVADHASCLKFVCSCDHGFKADDQVCSGASPMTLIHSMTVLALLLLTKTMF